MENYILIKDWKKDNGRLVKKGTILGLTVEKFNELEKLGIVKDRTKKPNLETKKNN